MAKVCAQCDQKIGMFKKPIDGIYCSYGCRDAARKEIEDNQKRAAEAAAATEREAKEVEARAAATAAQAQADTALKSTCPKCGAAWKYVAGTPDTGACDKCGFSSEFTAIEKCPTCTFMSLVVSASGARCPRCKFRRA
jgi:hypothetical protein